MKKRPFFITFEGTDGVGKSTQIKFLTSYLKKRGYEVAVTHEPGGAPLAKHIRKMLLNPRNRISPIAELLLYQVDRNDHVEHVIAPALKKGKIVVCDRFTDSTLAYQGYGRGINKDTISHLNQLAAGKTKPNLTLLLDLPPAQGLRNARARKRMDRLEKEGIKFQMKVRRGFLNLLKKYPRRIFRVPVQPDRRDTAALIQNIVRKKLGL